MIVDTGTTHLRFIALMTSPGIADLEVGFPVMVLAGGLGALLWGISADFLPVRRLLIAAATMPIPALACLWLPGGLAACLLLFSLILGGPISLPWVLLAETLPVNHFAKLALVITWAGLLGETLGPIYWGWALEVKNVGVSLWIVVAEMTVWWVLSPASRQVHGPGDPDIGVLVQTPSGERGRTSWVGWKRNPTSPPGQYWTGCAPTVLTGSATPTCEPCSAASRNGGASWPGSWSMQARTNPSRLFFQCQKMSLLDPTTGYEFR